jgi:hypothetical protein
VVLDVIVFDHVKTKVQVAEMFGFRFTLRFAPRLRLAMFMTWG